MSAEFRTQTKLRSKKITMPTCHFVNVISYQPTTSKNMADDSVKPHRSSSLVNSPVMIRQDQSLFPFCCGNVILCLKNV